MRESRASNGAPCIFPTKMKSHIVSFKRFTVLPLALAFVSLLPTEAVAQLSVSASTHDWTNSIGDSVFNTSANWGASPTNSTHLIPNGARDVFFGRVGYPTAGTISVPGYIGRNPYVASGNWTFDIATTTAKSWVFGYGSQSAPTVHFTGAPGTNVSFNVIGLGLDGSSNNRFGTGNNDTVTFADGVTYSVNSGVQLGSSGITSGGNNVMELRNRSGAMNSGISVYGYDNGTTRADNQLNIFDSNLTTTGTVLVEAGSSIVLENSQLNPGALTVGGDFTARNSGIQNQLITIASTGHLVLDAVSLEQSPTTSGGDLTTINGRFEVLNGSNYNVTHEHTATARVAVSGDFLIDGGSTFQTQGEQLSLAVLTGGTMEVNGNSTALVNRLALGGGSIQVEDGSEFRVGKMNAGNLNVQGRIIWEQGTDFGSTTQKGDLIVNSGTTLILDGGTYSMVGTGSSRNNADIQLNAGSRLIGSGTIGVNDNHETFLRFNGGELNPGTDESYGSGVMTLMNNFFATSGEAARITFDLFDEFSFDQILLGRSMASTDLNISINVWDSFDYSSVTEGTSFGFFRSLAYGDTDFLIGLVANATVQFDFGTSAAQLAEYGLMWDTSNLGTTGALGITAIPEPSTWMLICLGIAFALWKMRRKRIIT